MHSELDKHTNVLTKKTGCGDLSVMISDFNSKHTDDWFEKGARYNYHIVILVLQSIYTKKKLEEMKSV